MGGSVTTKRCERCRTVFRDRGQSACPRCGVPLNGAEPTAVARPEPRPPPAPPAPTTVTSELDSISFVTEPVAEPEVEPSREPIPPPPRPPTYQTEEVVEQLYVHEAPVPAVQVIPPTRPWYRKKRYIVILALIAIIAIAVIASSAGENGGGSPTADPSEIESGTSTTFSPG